MKNSLIMDPYYKILHTTLYINMCTVRLGGGGCSVHWGHIMSALGEGIIGQPQCTDDIFSQILKSMHSFTFFITSSHGGGSCR